jgi:hypothetical protein
MRLSSAAEKEAAIKAVTPADDTIAAQYRERDCRHLPPPEQLAITIHRPPVQAEELTADSWMPPALAQVAGNIEFRNRGLRLACLSRVNRDVSSAPSSAWPGIETL